MKVNQIPLEVALEGVPTKKISQLKKKGLETLDDLLHFLPRRYEDRSNRIDDFAVLNQYIDQKVVIAGTISDIAMNYGKHIITLTLQDGHKREIKIRWFNQDYLKKNFCKDERYVFYGKLHYSKQYGYDMAAPSYFSTEDDADKTPLPVYSKLPGMSTDYLTDCIHKALEFEKTIQCEDPIDETMREALGIVSLRQFFRLAHAPQSMEEVQQVTKRQIAETLLPFCMEMQERKYEAAADTDKSVNPALAKQALMFFRNKLSFDLTPDQNTTLEEMSKVVSSGKRLDALVQGDVGCGKTMIAEGMTAVMLSAGYQVAIMAPTTVLAEQHYAEFKERFQGNGKEIVYLGSKMKAAEKRTLLEKIKTGKAGVIIGTQAIIGKNVEYNALGLTITDEEHRFGVNQRKALREKAIEGAHSISMSATPIPRSLALALYGEETVVYNIHTMPAGRKPVTTIAYSDEAKTYEAMYRQIKAGRQVYVICPLISSSDAMVGVDSLEETETKMRDFYKKYPEVKIACINGKMKEEEIKDNIQRFAAGEFHILLSTTIVEVGVNVPNATVMVIKNAEHFGLAQLHQLRGRVGRGKYQSYCVLLCKDKSNPRIQAMVKTTDGFEIAKLDLEQRGMGNLVGTAQSGFDTAVNAMILHKDMYEKINSELDIIIQGKIRYDNTQKMVQVLSGRGEKK